MPGLIIETDRGLYCPAGGFHIDPWRPDPSMRAVITHGHSDHARPGAGEYVCARTCVPILRARLGAGAAMSGVEWGAGGAVRVGDVRVSLHPAGHTLGSAMIRVERVGGRAEGDEGGVWLVTGDYKLESDGVSEPAEIVRCDTLVTESTFGLPIYRWRPQATVFEDLNAWWRANQGEGRTTVVFAYALGKAQRVLANLDLSIGPVFAHGAIRRMNEAYAEAGARLPDAPAADKAGVRAAAKAGRAGLVLATGSADGSAWMKGFGDVARAQCSGWMAVRGTRRRAGMDRGFVLSDHADWDGLLSAVAASGATRVGVTHGYTGALSRWLCERGLRAWEVATRFTGEGGAGESEPAGSA